MQHTSKYQFKLIEGTDDFSPAPLNQNAQKTETLLAGMEEDLAALEADLAGQIQDVEESVTAVTTALGTGGHNARIAWGTYTGTGAFGVGSPNSLSFDFTPAVILIRTPGIRYTTVLVRGCTTSHGCINDSYEIQVSWTDTGVNWYSSDGSNTQNNSPGVPYYYTAVGYNS